MYTVSVQMKLYLVLNKCMSVLGIIKKEINSKLNPKNVLCLMVFSYVMSMLRVLKYKCGLSQVQK